jgi:2-oxoglutarate dehydrogenase E1 component
MDDVTKTLEALWRTSHLAGGNAPYLEELYESYLNNPDSIDPAWRAYFETLPRVNGVDVDISHSIIREHFRQLAYHGRSRRRVAPLAAAGTGAEAKQVRVLQLINAYRFRGHQQAAIDPLGRMERSEITDLQLSHHGLTESDLDTMFDTGSLVGPDKATLREILGILEQTYCGSIGAEYMYITNTAEKRWIQDRLEGARSQPQLAEAMKRRLLDRVTAAEGLEHYLHTKYVGQKRFSLEGGECLIPQLDEVIQRTGSHGVKEIVIGMAHRGRLNVLVNIMGKTPADLFLEFEGKAINNGNNSGDVKYHLGFSADIRTAGGPVHVVLAFNPSHLEIVGPVVEGSIRARQDRRKDTTGDLVLPVLIHGDAAFAGQGVVMETFNMSESRGYSTKGTVHIVINNQIGFTTSYTKDARSSFYCTDVAKMVDAPIFHVNGDDPEAVLFITQLAVDYRMTFHKDVVIDLVCYRRHGHSEADEPAATQPMMYRKIKDKPTARLLYAERLANEGIIEAGYAEARADYYRQAVDTGDSVAPNLVPKGKVNYPYASDWTGYLARNCSVPVNTRVDVDRIRELSAHLVQLPEGYECHPTVTTILENRRKMAAGAMPIDWGFAETMAYATLMTDGFHVRLSGQDSGRGTFFHRHAVIYNNKNGEVYVPLRHLPEAPANFLVINSLLSEEAVLAFEYGYATADPNTLVIWEAQFGDFANNAQVVVDQFISAGEQKWDRLCGLVLFLPHGFEGQGPEHSSARLERFLQLCAEHNMQVCVPSTSAQIFHLLRRQMLLACRKPLIVMTPKSLLRHRQAACALEDLSEGQFQTVIPEVDELDDRQVRRVILCAGRVYYDLLEKRRKDERKDVALIRIEQLYPFPKEVFKAQLDRYRHAKQVIWCQEEPKNQGAWFSSQHHMRALLRDGLYLQYAGRPISAAPAVGHMSLHIQQLHALLGEALGPAPKKR